MERGVTWGLLLGVYGLRLLLKRCPVPETNRRPTAVGDDSTDTFPAGAETAACCTVAGYGLAFLGALSSRRGAQKVPRGWSRSDEPP